MSPRYPHRHLLGIEGLERSDVLAILDHAEGYFELSRRPQRKATSLRGKTVINLFYESSTHTRTSFEIAGKRLSADVININVAQSSVGKGETLYDTVKTLEAMQPDVVVIRHSASGAPDFVAKHVRHSVVNAGDGMHEHPTQALLDAFTIRRHKGTLDGLVVTIIGDVGHSRVARSNAHLLRLFGCEVRIVGPRTLVPVGFDLLGVRVYERIEEALEGADVVMTLRIQQERLLGGAFIPTTREFSRKYGVGPARLKLAKPDALVMHPGPMNRGVEIDPTVADGPQSVVLDQVEAGVAVRAAVLDLLAGEGASA